VTKGRKFKNMFKNSGMNYFIGEWDFKSMRNDARRIRIFFSMLGVTECYDASNAEWKQLNNLIFGTSAKKTLKMLMADLIALAADKEMKGHKLDKLINKIDDIILIPSQYPTICPTSSPE